MMMQGSESNVRSSCHVTVNFTENSRQPLL